MYRQRGFLLCVAVAMAAATPAMGQTLLATGPAVGETYGAPFTFSWDAVRYTPEFMKARADCTQQANDRRLGANTIRKRNFLRRCMPERGFSGAP
jgi:hypothetical protein